MSYFHEDELKCKCSANNGAGCGMDIKPYVRSKLDKARELAGIPFIITSGARCLEYNRSIGSKDSSSHVKGVAVDIMTETSQDRYKILYALYKAGFKRIGINFKSKFIHTDLDEDKPQELIFGY